MLVCPFNIFTALAIGSVVGEKGKTGMKQFKMEKKNRREKRTPTAEPGPGLY